MHLARIKIFLFSVSYSMYKMSLLKLQRLTNLIGRLLEEKVKALKEPLRGFFSPRFQSVVVFKAVVFVSLRQGKNFLPCPNRTKQCQTYCLECQGYISFNQFLVVKNYQALQTSLFVLFSSQIYLH